MAEMRLIDAPVGLFYSGRTLCVKTEYFTNGGVDAYIVSSGEYFHGGAQTSEERNNLMVRPVNQRNLRPVGVWAIEGEDIIWGNSLKRRYCTNCCERPHFDKEKRKFILTPFCHNCGARMKGESDVK